MRKLIMIALTLSSLVAAVPASAAPCGLAGGNPTCNGYGPGMMAPRMIARPVQMYVSAPMGQYHHESGGRNIALGLRILSEIIRIAAHH